MSQYDEKTFDKVTTYEGSSKNTQTSCVKDLFLITEYYIMHKRKPVSFCN